MSSPEVSIREDTFEVVAAINSENQQADFVAVVADLNDALFSPALTFDGNLREGII